MNKAILVIEQPMFCNECPLHVGQFEYDKRFPNMKYVCIACAKEIDDYYDELGNTKPIWCPLKTLEKKEIKNKRFVKNVKFTDEYLKLFNYDIRKILEADDRLEYFLEIQPNEFLKKGYNDCIDDLLG